MTDHIGVAVIGAGMAGKAHAAAYRAAPTLYNTVLPTVRLVSIADVSEPLAAATAARFGYDRYDVSWQAIAAAKDIDVVSVVVANSLHREIVEALLATGKHVLCEKPLAGDLADGRAMVTAAETASTVASIGLTFLRSPGIAFIQRLVASGRLGTVRHVTGHYWADYSADANAPISWRYKGPGGSGALADIGSHLSYLAEFLGGGDFVQVRGGMFSTVVASRPIPVGTTVGHEKVSVSTERDTVENDDVAAFSGSLANGATATLQVSRVSSGHPNSLALEVFGEFGSARFDFRHPGEVQLFLAGDEHAESGFRTVVLGPDHPYWRSGLPMDAPGVGIGQNEGFVFQARAFLEEVAGVPETASLPRNATLRDGLHNMELLAAVAQSAQREGASIKVPF